jgi:hypothetical protein
MKTISLPWKQVLVRQADALVNLREPHRWSTASAVKLEETVVVGFYAVRRLVNAFLLGPAIVHRPIRMTAFPARPRDSLLLGRDKIEDLYDLKTARQVSHDLLFLCHQVIQNCIFEPGFDADRNLDGLFVTSDHQRKVALYGVKCATLEVLFREIGSDR